MPTQIEVPSLGESVTQAVLVKWHKGDGEAVAVDEAICELETDKANVDVPAKAGGVLKRLKKEGDTVAVGEAIASIDEQGKAAPSAKATAVASTPSSSSAPPAQDAAGAKAMEDFSPAVRRLLMEHNLNPVEIPASGPGGRLTKEDVEGYLAKRERGNGKPQRTPPIAWPAASQASVASAAPASAAASRPAIAPSKPSAMQFDAKGEFREPMSKIRKRIAETLVKAQQTAAILTTFNEVDLTEVIALRARYKEQFEKTHGVGLGFMSFFTRAVCMALHELPRVNAFIDGEQIVYHRHVHLGIAVSTDRGLAVPVLKNADAMSFARIESEIKRLANATREGKLGLDELSGGTFSITNGGVYGSLNSTPILTPPQSGILGMHAIQKRPVVINDKIEVRSMMYLALSYDHRIVDGKEAITFLVRVKQMLEDPARLMLEI